MSDEDDDLFADSGDDTDDLIAASKKDSKPVAKPKKLKKKGATTSVDKKRKRNEKPIPGRFSLFCVCCSFYESFVKGGTRIKSLAFKKKSTMNGQLYTVSFVGCDDFKFFFPRVP